ncbi:MAG: DUF1987 domain-containing protein [Desulfovibrionaceae bacterium]|mgnify:FL=1
MQPFVCAPTRSTPEIRFDAASNRHVMKGECYPENAAAFFGPLFAWVKNYLSQQPAGPVVFDLELVYFNSSSSKALLDLFEILEKAATAGTRITVNWRYDKDNDIAGECGEEFAEDAKALSFKLMAL